MKDLLFAGNEGRATLGLATPEALTFRSEGLSLGVPSAHVFVELESENMLENFALSRGVIQGSPTLAATRSILLVASPCFQRRAWLTCRRQLPGVRVLNHPPETSLEDEQRLLLAKGVRLVDWVKGEVERIPRYQALDHIAGDPLPDLIQAMVEFLG